MDFDHYHCIYDAIHFYKDYIYEFLYKKNEASICAFDYMRLGASNMKICLEVWLWLFFKVIFTYKYIKIIYFLFFKNYF